MRILNRNYEKVIGRTRQMAGLVRRELKSSVGRSVPLAARLRMMRRGFLSESYVLYDLERNDPTLYLSDLSRFVRTFHINRSPHVLDDKFVFAVMLDSLAVSNGAAARARWRGAVHVDRHRSATG